MSSANPLSRHTFHSTPQVPIQQAPPSEYVAKASNAIRALTPIVTSCLLVSKQINNKDLTDNFAISQKIISWLDATHKLSFGNLLKPIQNNLEDIVSSPSNFSAFMGAVNSLIQIWNIPLGLVGTSDSAKLAHQHFLTASINASEMKTATLLINGSLKKPIPATASKREKLQLVLEKIETLTTLSSLGAKKCNFQMVLAGLSLVNVVVQLSKLHLETTAVPPLKLFEMVKSKAEMTLKIHSETLPDLFNETNFAQSLTVEEREEISREITNLATGHLALLATQDNDNLVNQLLEYQNSMMAMLEVYGVDTSFFEENIESLQEDCQVLIEERITLQTRSGEMLTQHLSFIEEQQDKLKLVHEDYKQKVSEDVFNKYISKDFEKAFESLNQAKEQTQQYLSELQPQQYGVIPFELMSLKEQIEWSQKITQFSGESEKQNLLSAVKYACREG